MTVTTAEPDVGDVTTSSRADLVVAGARVQLGGTPVLRGVDLVVPTGGTVALLGPSGCGKTTLLRAIAGLQALDHGTVSLDGRDVTDVPAERRRIGMVFQDGALFPHMDVAANVAFGLPRRMRGRGAAVADALEMVGLGGLQHRPPATLSGGQQQRVALARAVVARPSVLLLDEPFSSLDATLRTQVRTDVADLLRTLQITSMVVTHDQEEAFLLGDEVAVMIDGQIHQQAPPSEIYAAPATRELAIFLGEANLLTGAVTDRVAQTWIGRIPVTDTAGAGLVDVLVRPEHLRMHPDGPLVVDAVEYYGHDAITRLRGPHGALRVRTMAMPPFRTGDAVGVAYDGPPAVAFRP